MTQNIMATDNGSQRDSWPPLTSDVELDRVGVGAALGVGGDAVVRPARVPAQPLQDEALVPHDDAAPQVLSQRRALKKQFVEFTPGSGWCKGREFCPAKTALLAKMTLFPQK